MKQIKILAYVNDMLVELVKYERENGNLGANKQSVVNEMVIAQHKKLIK